MRVLVACEESAVVRDAFRARGHDAWSCDLEPTRGDPAFHLQCDVREVLEDNWDLMIAHPPCDWIAVSGYHWNKRGRRGYTPEECDRQSESALLFVQQLMRAPIEKICIENPVSIISSRIRKPDQIIQPYQFGHDASKKTCLWLKNLPRLVGTKYVEPRMVNGLPRWANQTDSGQNRLGPSETRARDRAVTYQGIADAMADQWAV